MAEHVEMISRIGGFFEDGVVGKEDRVGSYD